MRNRKRRIFIIVFLSLTLTMSVLPSFASLTSDDATVVFPTVPISSKGWIVYTNSAGVATSNFSDSYYSYNMQGSNAGFWWRLNSSFKNYPNYVANNRTHTIMAWEYDSTLDLAVNYVYSFDITIRFTNSIADLSSFAWEKMYLCFITDPLFYQEHSFSLSQANSYIPVKYAPTSATFNGVSNITLHYNIGVYPSSFANASTDIDNGVEFIPVYSVAIWNYNSGAAYQYTDGNNDRYIDYQIFPYNTGSIRAYSPEEWSDHVLQQGFNDISSAITTQTVTINGVINQAAEDITDSIDQASEDIQGSIDQASEDIQGSIDQAADDIINAGEPYDMSDLEAAHEPEEQLINSLNSTIAYTPAGGTALASQISTFFHGDRATSIWTSWLQYFYEQNVIVRYLFIGTLSTICIYMVFKAVF